MRRAWLIVLACALAACGSGQSATQSPSEPDNAVSAASQSPASTDPESEASGEGSVDDAVESVGLSLLIGVDAGEGDWRTGGVRSDVLMVMVPGQSPAVISLPRDSWVHIPGHGEAKINAAYAWGGPDLTKETVSDLLGQPIDHAYAVDMAGFIKVIDSIGPIELDTASGHLTLTGEEALSFVRERKSLPRGDLDRILRQQAVLSAIAADMGPSEALSLAGEVLPAISADGAEAQPEDLLAVFTAMRGATFATVPVAGLGWEGEQSVVYLDADGMADLVDALRLNDMTEWLETAETLSGQEVQ